MFNLFSECVGKAPILILANINYVKKVVFPLEILPWVVLGSALFHTFISVFVWLIVYLALFGLPHVSVLLLPLIILRSEEHTSELQSLMRISYAVFCLKK